MSPPVDSGGALLSAGVDISAETWIMVTMPTKITAEIHLSVWDDGSVDVVMTWTPDPEQPLSLGSRTARRLSADAAADLTLVLLDEAARR